MPVAELNKLLEAEFVRIASTPESSRQFLVNMGLIDSKTGQLTERYQ